MAAGLFCKGILTVIIKIIAVLVAIIVVIGAIMGAQTGDLDFWLALCGGMLALFAGVVAMEARRKAKTGDASNEESTDRS